MLGAPIPERDVAVLVGRDDRVARRLRDGGEPAGGRQQPLGLIAQAPGHVVERRRHRRGFGAASHRHLAAPVALGDVPRGLRDVHQRPARAAAEDDATAQRQDEPADAGQQERALQLVEKLLRRRPVLQQNERPHIVGRAIGEQGKRAFDEPAIAELPHVGRDAAKREQTAAAQCRLDLLLLIFGQAAADERAARIQSSLPSASPVRALVRPGRRAETRT